MSIPEHIIEQLTDTADLVGIIGKHVDLKRAGNSFKGCCPFHKEKTPSFYVKPNEGYYYCFGCKATGNAISFLMDYEGQNFLEAVDTLSAQTGIDVPKSAPNPATTYKKNKRNTEPKTTPNDALQAQTKPSDTPTKNQSDSSDNIPTNDKLKPQQTPASSLDDINFAMAAVEDPNYVDDFSTNWQDASTASATSTQALNNVQEQITRKPTGDLYELLDRLLQFYIAQRQKSPKALMYFNQRNILEKTMNVFGLGYAPTDWQHLHKEFAQDIEGLEKLGLIRNSDKSKKSFCLLRDRVIFPIKDHKGRVVGFAGRTLDKDAQPKYINSPESVVFKKQHILYGLYEGRKARAENWLIVEGYMDVISLYQAGIYGAVASMGTATNVEQIKKLFKQSPKLTLAFDGDNAGRTAAWRTLEISLPALLDEYELKFLILPEKEDPDSLVKSEGAVAMQQRIDNAPPLSEFLITELSTRYDMATPEGKSHLMSALKKLLKNLPEYSSYRRLLTNEVKEKLGLAYTPFKSKEQRQAEQARVNKYRDTLLNFDSKYDQESLLLYLIILAPQLAFETDATQESDNITNDLFELMDKNSKLYQAYESILKWQPVYQNHCQNSPLAYSHFILASLANNDELLLGMSDFFKLLTLTEENFNINDMDAWLKPIYEELCLLQVAKVIQNKLKRESDLSIQKQLNDSLTQVRKKLQFREKQV